MKQKIESQMMKGRTRRKMVVAASAAAVRNDTIMLIVMGDGIPWRTLPGTHPEKGAYFTRGTSHTDPGAYTEDGTIQAATLDRINAKFETAKQMVPAPVIRTLSAKSRLGIINYGSTDPAVGEALALMMRDGHGLNHMRLRAFPFGPEVLDFIERHDYLFVVEQNRDAQMRQLLMVEAGAPAEKLVPVTNYDGLPLTADFIIDSVYAALESNSRVAGASAPPITTAQRD